MVADRHTESVPLIGVGPGFVEGRAGHPNTVQANQGAAIIETGHDLAETLVLPAQKMSRRHPHIVEKQRATTDRAHADIVETGTTDAGAVEVDQEG